MKFKLWLENSEIQTTILGVLPSPLVGSREDDQRLLQSRATDFSSHIVNRLKNLGIISSLKDIDPIRWREINDGIEKGTLTIGEIIEKLEQNKI